MLILSKVGYLVFFKTIQTTITSENYLEKTILLQAIKSFKLVTYFLKSTSWIYFMNYKTKKTNRKPRNAASK
jgi:hypothetical protein